MIQALKCIKWARELIEHWFFCNSSRWFGKLQSISWLNVCVCPNLLANNLLAVGWLVVVLNVSKKKKFNILIIFEKEKENALEVHLFNQGDDELHHRRRTSSPFSFEFAPIQIWTWWFWKLEEELELELFFVVEQIS